MPMTMQAHWEFHCPECGFGHQELGSLVRDHDLFCEICDHETGRVIALHRWLSEPAPATGPTD